MFPFKPGGPDRGPGPGPGPDPDPAPDPAVRRIGTEL